MRFHLYSARFKIIVIKRALLLFDSEKGKNSKSLLLLCIWLMSLFLLFACLSVWVCVCVYTFAHTSHIYVNVLSQKKKKKKKQTWKQTWKQNKDIKNISGILWIDWSNRSTPQVKHMLIWCNNNHKTCCISVKAFQKCIYIDVRWVRVFGQRVSVQVKQCRLKVWGVPAANVLVEKLFNTFTSKIDEQ